MIGTLIALAEPEKNKTKLQPEFSAKTTSPFTAVLKRGHSVSYFGLFLFTLFLYVRPYEFFPSLIWLRGLAFWIALATITIYIPTQVGLDGNLTIRPREVNCVLLLFLLAMLSIPLGVDIGASWNSAMDYIKVVMMFIVLVNVARTERRLKLLIILVLVVSVALSFAAVNDYRTGALNSNGERIKGIIGGMFDNPNDLALHLVTMIPIAAALGLASRTGFMKLLYIACSIVLVAGVVASFSRGGFLGLIFMAGVFGWRIATKNRWIIMIAPVFLIAFIAFAPGGYGKRLSTTSDGSAEARTDDLKRSVFIAARHPLLGVGIGNYIIFSNKSHASHNAYTQVAAEVGLTALVMYVMFLITPIKELRKIIHETPTKGDNSRFHYLAIGFEASLVGYMVSSFFASVAFLWYAYYLVGYAICLKRLYAAGTVPKAEPVITDPLQRPAPVKSPIITVG